MTRPTEPTASDGPSDAELERTVPSGSAARELRVGAFVLLGIASFVAVLFLLTDPATLRGRYMLVTTMPDAGGVRRGDPVQMRGVNIGRIHAFEMTPEGEVHVTMEIEGDWRVPEGSRAELGEVGLFGGRTMEVAPGDGPRMLEPYDTMPGTSDGTDLFQTAGDLGQKAETVLTRLSEVLDDPTVRSVRNTAGELEALIAELKEIAGSQRAELTRLTGSLNRSADGLEAAAGAGPDVARAVARADSTLETLNRTSRTLDDALASLEVVLGRLERGEGTLGRLSRDDSLYVNLNRAVESIHLLATDVRENPGRYIKVEIF